MRKNIYFVVFICFLGFQNQAQIAIPKNNGFNETELLHHIKTLSSDAFEGRRTGTKGGVKAVNYIVDHFKTRQVLPLVPNYTQPFAFSSEGKHFNGTNVLGLIKGTSFPEKYIVITAHHDHEGIKNGQIYNGADDDASGVSALFAFAEFFKNHAPKHSVILAAFDAEELGLEGSKYYIGHPIVPLNQIKVNLNMDMISRSDEKELFVVGTIHNKWLKDLIISNKYSNKIKLLTGHDEGNWEENWTHASDHASFHKKGIPFLYFGVEDHKDYHEPTDDYENIQPEFYKEAVKVIMAVFQKMDALQL
ncbi:MAG: M28 family peptidase [Confluentibacter sp.]|nr:M28 family peptidase [Confluentibacter sp.]HMQ42715.1 M28 family peptidase [Mariniflexile sp.]